MDLSLFSKIKELNLFNHKQLVRISYSCIKIELLDACCKKSCTDLVFSFRNSKRKTIVKLKNKVLNDELIAKELSLSFTHNFVYISKSNQRFPSVLDEWHEIGISDL